MSIAIQAGTPLAEQLSILVQPKLVEIGWSSGGLDDSALAEYIILMLASGKDQPTIATELATDLLSLSANDQGAQDFAKWLFEQIAILTGTAPVQEETQAIPSFDDASRGRPQPDQDTEMGDGGDSAGGSIPTGPKSMRGGRGGRGGRLANQLTRAMDRNDVLHRVRPQSGERINTHNRAPPKGPRGGIQNRQFNGGVPTGPKGSSSTTRGSSSSSTPQFSQQQQAQLFTMLSQIMGGSIPGMPDAVPGSSSKSRPATGAGRSLADRIGRTNGHTNGSQRQQSQSLNGDGDISMDGTDSSIAKDPTSETICKFNLHCSKPDCPFAHQSPAAPPGVTIDPNDTCSFGAACQNPKCTARHPSPATKRVHQAEQECKFFPNCTNPHCNFKHPTMPLCRNGADCKVEGCKFTHLATACRFRPCTNPICVYKHEEGQRVKVPVRTYADMTWTPEKAALKKAEHVSERKFVDVEEGMGEELILADAPEAVTDGPQTEVKVEEGVVE